VLEDVDAEAVEYGVKKVVKGRRHKVEERRRTTGHEEGDLLFRNWAAGMSIE